MLVLLNSKHLFLDCTVHVVENSLVDNMVVYPNFLIIGAMKCATSSLQEQLMLQSGIFMTELKEPNFFSDDKQYEKGISWYTSLFTPKEVDTLYGEASTHYTKLPTYPETITRIKKNIPESSKLKFIYVMRHPIDRLISQYMHEWTQKTISANTDINEAIHKYPELIDYSKYCMQLQPYLDSFGEDRVLPVFFERLVDNPEEELERICQFLNYPYPAHWHQDLAASNVSSKRMRKSEWRDFLVETPGLKTIRKRLVPHSFRERVKKLWMMSERPQLSVESLEYLETIFDQDLRKLGCWLDMKSLCCNNFKDLVKRKKTPLFRI